MNAGWRRSVRGLVAAVATAGLAPVTGAQQPLPLDCASCHPSVHATMVNKGQETSGRCTTCHATTHDAVRKLFEGTGGGAVKPDRMFEARVGCRACHTDAVLAARAEAPRLAGINDACVSCHGARFAKMLPRWNEALTRRRESARAYVDAAAADTRLAAQSGAQVRLAAAQADLKLVVDGVGLHNLSGADALLRSAIRQAGAAYRSAAQPVPTPPALGPDPAAVSCAYCHYGVETVATTTFGQSFNHADHVVSADIACATCHSSAGFFADSTHQLDPRHGRTTVTAAACSACHHVTSTQSCTSCHAAEGLAARPAPVTLPLRLRPAGAPTTREVTFRHDVHGKVECASCHTSRPDIATVAACTSCHESHHRDARDCTTCHTTTLRPLHTSAEHFACASCHARGTLELVTGDRTFCLSCHVDRRDHHVSRECATCHMQMSPAEVKARILGRQP